MEWYYELDFEENPFEVDPLISDFNLIGREKEANEILYRILSGNILLIEAKEGVGKTALLKYAIDNFKGKGKVIYVNAKKLSRRLNISELIRKRPKGMILLMDNVQYLSKKNSERIKYYYDEDRIKSVVFTTTDYSLVDFTDAIKERLGHNIITLKPLKPNEIVNIVKDRLEENKDMFPDDVAKKLFTSSKNLKEFIVKCDILCSYVIEEDRETASIDDIKKISIERTYADNDIRDTCSECNDNLMMVGKYWRCENCDQYCTLCGALIENDDNECPECNAVFVEEKAE